jgi:hypothetical protein
MFPLTRLQLINAPIENSVKHTWHVIIKSKCEYDEQYPCTHMHEKMKIKSNLIKLFEIFYCGSQWDLSLFLYDR